MKFKALDASAREISIDDFFAKYEEFAENYKLAEQTSRYLKAMLRNPKMIPTIAEKVGNEYVFPVFGRKRRYTICIEVRGDVLVLKSIS